MLPSVAYAGCANCEIPNRFSVMFPKKGKKKAKRPKKEKKIVL